MTTERPKRKRRYKPAKAAVSIRIDRDTLDRLENYMDRNNGGGFRSRSELLGRLVLRGIVLLERQETKNRNGA